MVCNVLKFPEADTSYCEAHEALFNALSRLGTLLAMLQDDGFTRFQAMHATQQAEYLWTCFDLAVTGQRALAVMDGVAEAGNLEMHS